MRKSVPDFFYSKLFYIIVLIVVILVNIFVYRFTMDMIVLLLGVIAFVKKKEKEFLRDWTFPLILFYAYEFLRGRADVVGGALGRGVYYKALLDIEKSLFSINGEIPTVFLQNKLAHFTDGVFNPVWYDYIFFFAYVSFFWVWILVGYKIWRKNRSKFKMYIYGLIAFSLFDTLIYIWYPTAPPWIAGEIGLLPHLPRLMFFNYIMSVGGSVFTYGNNLYAAFPSHHVAWVWFAALFVVDVFGKKWLPIFIIPILVAVATWYGAEHYVVDSIAGVIIATITFVVFRNIKRIRKNGMDEARTRNLLSDSEML